ncbi:hypothetical protein V2J09_018804 [Rumex salicifolius]
MGIEEEREQRVKVTFGEPRSFSTTLKSDLKETFFPDDPFGHFSDHSPLRRSKLILEYFVPILQWLPSYNTRLFGSDLLAGLTTASLAIPQGISYANLTKVPPIVGLYSSFVPPFIYTVFGSSKNVSVGTVAACSLLLAQTIGSAVDASLNPTLYLNLVLTATLVAGLFQTALGILRLGILVDFLSHSTITGFMGGTAILIILQQLKGFLGMQHFTDKTDVVSVLKAIFKNRNEWRWESAVVGCIFLAFLVATRQLKNKKPRLFWVSAMAPLATVIIGGLFAYFGHMEKHGIAVVGHLSRGINPLSIDDFVFDSKYLPTVIKAGLITAILGLSEGIAIGRSFALMKNQKVDGNKEIIAFGLMNIVGSCTSCYLTTGPFSKTAVNVNAGCKTQMSNAVMGLCVMLTLLLLAPLFSYTPLVALSAIIMSAMFGLIEYENFFHLYKVDKYDFVICMAAFLGVAFIDMDHGLGISVALGIIRAVLYTARPANIKLGKIQSSNLYRDVEQYPVNSELPGILIIQLGSPVYFTNSNYLKERGGSEMKSVTTIDMTGVETFFELNRILDVKRIKMYLVNPRREVMEKMIAGKFLDSIGKESVFVSIEDAVHYCNFTLNGDTNRKPEIIYPDSA